MELARELDEEVEEVQWNVCLEEEARIATMLRLSGVGLAGERAGSHTRQCMVERQGFSCAPIPLSRKYERGPHLNGEHLEQQHKFQTHVGKRT